VNASAALTTRFLLVACALLTAPAAAQRGPAPDPLVKENATVQLAEHTYVIPDNSVPLVPNVGIVIGSRATLVIDPGLGSRNGQRVLLEVAKVSRNTNLYVATTHFHVEHTTGVLAFPAAAKYVNSKVQEADFAEGGAQQAATLSSRLPLTAELLSGAAAGRKADITFATGTTSSIWVAFECASSSWARHTRAATRRSSWRAMASCSPETS
jgi:hypothetical protein